ncbi:MAG: protein translocase subunit SecF [Candidatus Parabeggiatoa sp. nov. 3]|jgi:preprotein translocase subunit SecF|nr:MAG: protein translocase subunit SecF [Gammaproteobacteria bacterium]RKZ69403.1 MAG: protein translocase subunit SecF [Gammaproteobacteria bacterium]RKZ84325.1 MAG: protein translocase subunit SecF [Gammaproteobacteria bacterium]
MFLNRFDYKIDFMGKRHIAVAISTLLMVVCLGSLFIQGLVFGIDFTGGTLVEVGYEQSVELEKIRSTLHENGFPDAVVQHFGTTKDVSIRLGMYEESKDDPLSSQILRLLEKNDDDVVMRRVEYVGPQIGGELVEKGGLAVLYTLFGVLIYVAFRFEYRFALGAIAALIHDTLIVVGFFSLFRLEFDLTVLAAVLAVIGYSLNDTIVVFDRIRENFVKMRKQSSIAVMNTSINQMLGRTIMTSVTTALVLIVLFVVGGELIHSFSTALLLGVIIGTYSSIYIASASALALGVSKADLMPVQKEGVEKKPEHLHW